MDNLNFKPNILEATANLSQVAAILQSSALKIVLICDENCKLLGTIVDGDIRRCLIQQVSPNTPAGCFMNSAPLCVNEKDAEALNYRDIEEYGVDYIPLTNDRGELVDLIAVSSLRTSPNLNCPVFLFAGGRGRRLAPLTNDVPKPMVKVNGRPIIENLIRHLSKNGATKFYISVHYLKEVIMDHLGDGSSFGVSIEYIEEEQPLGTAGSLSLLNEYPEHLLVMNSDLIINGTLSEFKREMGNGSELVIGTRYFDYQIPFGVVEHTNDGKVTQINEKPVVVRKINSGIYMLSRSALEVLTPNKYIDMPDLILRCIETEKNVVCANVDGIWLDIGTQSSLEIARNMFAEEIPHD